MDEEARHPHAGPSPGDGRPQRQGLRVRRWHQADTPTGGNWFPTNRSWEYTPETDSWREIAGMPTKRGGGFATVLDGKIYNSVSRAVEAYDPATDRWMIFPNLPQARHGQGGGIIGNRFHIVSGHITPAFSGGEPLNVTSHDAFEFQ